MSEDLIDWLRAQIDEDEHIARKATSGDPWRMEGMSIRGGTRMNHTDVLVVRHTWPQEAEHIVRHDPARVLREVEALRAIIDLHEPREYVTYLKHVTYWQCGYCAGLCHSRSGLGCEEPVDALWPCDTVRLVAAIFSGRPGFREEWRLQ